MKSDFESEVRELLKISEKEMLALNHPYVGSEHFLLAVLKSDSKTREILNDFSAKYEYVGRNTVKQMGENLDFIRKNLFSDCVLGIMLGGELYYEKNTFDAYKDRHIIHRQMNEAVRNWAQDYDNVKLIDVNKYLVDQSSFYDHFNH